MKIKSRILSGALMLFSANLIVKLAGAVYKIPLQRILTDTGMGYFNVAYSIYTWFYLISTAGLPIAVSVCVAKALAEGDRVKAEAVYRVSALIFSSAKMISTVLLFMYSSAGRLSIPAGTCVCYAVSALMNIVFLRGSDDPVPSAYDVIKPALCSVICGLTAGTVFTFAGQTFYGAAPTIIATVSAAAVYSGALTVTGYTKTIFDGIRMKNKEKDHKNDRIREKREVQL